MGIRVAALAVAAFSLALAACAPNGQAQEADASSSEPGVNAEPSGIQSTTIRGIDLTIANDGMTCDIVIGEEFVSLALPPPCRFLERGESGEATLEDYGENGAVVLVGGPLVAHSDYKRFNGRKPADICSYIAQPVFVKEGAVSVGEMVADSQGFCGQAAPDEKFYYGLAHPEG